MKQGMGDMGICVSKEGKSPHRPVADSQKGTGIKTGEGLNEQEEQSNSTKQFIL